MNANMAGFMCFLNKFICIIVIWMKAASALEGLMAGPLAELSNVLDMDYSICLVNPRGHVQFGILRLNSIFIFRIAFFFIDST